MLDTNASVAAPCPSRSLDALALAARKKVPGAEEALVQALLVKLRPIVRYRVHTSARGALSQADVDDVLQDVVLLVWQRDLPVFDPSKSGFLTFANRRLRWHLADCARRARRSAGDEVDDIELEAVVDVDRDPEALLDLHRAEVVLRDMERAIGGADRSAREVLVRHDLRGATLMEVAKELHIHVSNACRARQRGLRHLARHLEALV